MAQLYGVARFAVAKGPACGCMDMGDLTSAVNRLLAAAERLERAAAARAGRERSLLGELEHARTGHERAVRDGEEMSRRLEAAIGRLEAVLES